MTFSATRAIRIAIAAASCSFATAASAQSADWSFAKIADYDTAIPGGSGKFRWLSEPAISGPYAAFYGAPAAEGAPDGIYSSAFTGLTRIADTSTTAPGETTPLWAFGIPVHVFEDRIAFSASGSHGKGVYLSAGGTISRIVDADTPLPAGGGRFVLNGMSGPYVSRDSVMFALKGGTGDTRGVYTSKAGVIRAVADTATPIPGGTGTFENFDAAALDGTRIAFIGSGANAQVGVYLADESAIVKLADTQTLLPEANERFVSFHGISLSGSKTVFWGKGSGGREGIYVSDAGVLKTIVDTSTVIPGGTGTFVGFWFPGVAWPVLMASVSGDIVVFTGKTAPGHGGVYASMCGALSKVVAPGDRILGRTVSGASLQDQGVSGTAVGLLIFFEDGFSGLYRAEYAGSCRTSAQPADSGCAMKTESGRLRIIGNCSSVDPLALLLPTRIYLGFTEIHDPREPILASVETMFRAMTPEERRLAVERAELVRAYLGAVDKVARKYPEFKRAVPRPPQVPRARPDAASSRVEKPSNPP